MPARDCGRHAAGLPVKQPVCEHGLETLDVNAESGLGAMLSSSGLAEAAFLISRNETSNLLKIHGIHQCLACVQRRAPLVWCFCAMGPAIIKCYEFHFKIFLVNMPLRSL